ncbi:MAG TPA: TRAP transporter substrate-binding protein DctP [Casimicrobiaceae bacterium]
MPFFLRGVAATALLLLASTFACAQGGGAGDAQRAGEWKLSTALGPAYPQGKAGERWAALIRERSAGRLTVHHYPGATLFQRDASREFAALRDGSVALAVGSTTAWAPNCLELNLIGLPWLFPDERALKGLLDGAVVAELAARLEAAGIIAVAWAPNGFVEIASTRPLRTPADLTGLKVRTAGTAMVDETVAALGAVPVAMTGVDARRAALAGALDAEETTIDAFRASRAATAGFTHLQLWGAHADALVFAVNPGTWSALSVADRELVRQAARDAAMAAVALRLRLSGDASLGQAGRQGAVVTRLTAAGKDAFRQAARPVYDKWAGLIGSDLVHRAEATISATR